MLHGLHATTGYWLIPQSSTPFVLLHEILSLQHSITTSRTIDIIDDITDAGLPLQQSISPSGFIHRNQNALEAIQRTSQSNI
jgi:hypothetical protein